MTEGCSLFSRNFITFSALFFVLLLVSCCGCICCCGPKKFFKRLKKTLGCVFKVACCLWLCKKTSKEVDEEMDDEELNLKKQAKKDRRKKAKLRKQPSTASKKQPSDPAQKHNDSGFAGDMESSSQQLNAQSNFDSSQTLMRL